jgi:hypothetical protein
LGRKNLLLQSLIEYYKFTGTHYCKAFVISALLPIALKYIEQTNDEGYTLVYDLLEKRMC